MPRACLFGPRNRSEFIFEYNNNGANEEEHYLINPDDPGGGSLPFRRRVRDVASEKTNDRRDRDIGVYFQDAWRPNDRLNISAGIRADFVRRLDGINDIERMNTVAVGPRVGFSWTVTEDAKNVIRASYSRVHEQVNGRDASSSFGSWDTLSGFTDFYDTGFNGQFETAIRTPPRPREIVATQFDPDLHQPFADEYVVGYRRQFPSEIGLDVAFIRKRARHIYAEVDINGFYPDAPFQPFGGFGRIDPLRGQLKQVTNNTWSDLAYSAIEIVLAKRMTNNFSFLASLNRQWHKLDGTWNPTDPAGFIQPNAFANSRCIWMPRGMQDDNSLQLGSNSTYCPTWRDYSYRLGASYHGPWGVVLAGSYTHQAGPWSGAIFSRLDAPDPTFGSAQVTLPDGSTQGNPLATAIRFRFPTRNENQVKLGDTKRISIKVGKQFELGDARRVDVAFNFFNIPNFGDFQQYTYNGGNSDFNQSFLQPRNRQPGRGVQFDITLHY